MDRPNADAVDDFLAHHGVKGMKWGVRKQRESSSSGGPTKKDQKSQKKWEKKASGANGFFKDYNAAAQHMNKVGIDQINNKPAYKGKDLSGDTPLSRKYNQEMADALTSAMTRAAEARVGSSPIGGRKLTYDATPDGDILFKWTDAQHDSLEDFKIIGTRDAKGHITSIEISAPLEQSDEVDEFLAHYGVKGMKWGVRKSQTPVAVAVTERAGKRVRTSGGKNQGPAADAISVAVARQKAKKSTTDSLSNAELRKIVERMQLEQQYHRLNPSAKSVAQNFVRKTVLQIGQEQVTSVARQSATKQVAKVMAKVA